MFQPKDGTGADVLGAHVADAAAAAAEATTAAAGRYEIEVASTRVDRELLLKLRTLLEQHRGAVPVCLVVEVPAVARVIIDISRRFSVQPDPELRRQVQMLFT
ncbi:MAG: hypothetical protein JXR83_03080 [Deltaproteobacteria bacterium]|nr:hypothetical protein [Deltaproteobacteria bacterium]